MRNSDKSPEAEANGHYLPWFKCWWKDHFALTVGWPDCAVVLLFKLQALQWSRGSLPSAPEKIRKLVGVKSAQWREAWEFVEPQFPRCDDGVRRNARLDDELAESLRRVETNRKNGVLGARKRWSTAGKVVDLHPDRGGKK